MKGENKVITEIIKGLVGKVRGNDYFETVSAIAKIFPKRLTTQLKQLVNGPVWDGDIMSKPYRDELIDMGIGIRVCAKGEQGYTGSTYIGYSILRELREIEELEGGKGK